MTKCSTCSPSITHFLGHQPRPLSSNVHHFEVRRPDLQDMTCKNSHGLVSPYEPPAGGSGERGQSHSLCWLVWPVNVTALPRRTRWAGWMSTWLRCCTGLTLRPPADGCWTFGSWLQQCPKKHGGQEWISESRIWNFLPCCRTLNDSWSSL